VPQFVSQSLRAGQKDWMAEVRTVTIVFVAVQSPPTSAARDLLHVQHMVANSVETMEQVWGGATRQITVDEKGKCHIYFYKRELLINLIVFEKGL
jgi:hypothetical protein